MDTINFVQGFKDKKHTTSIALQFLQMCVEFLLQSELNILNFFQCYSFKVSLSPDLLQYFLGLCTVGPIDFQFTAPSATK